MNETVTIRLSEELKDGLQKVSKMEDKPVSDVVRESIKMYVAVRRFRAVRNRILPFAEAAGLLTDDDVFKGLK